MPTKKIELFHHLTDAFSKNEIKDICFRLGIDFDNIPGETKADIARELILYVERRNGLEALEQLVFSLRPGPANAQDSPSAHLIAYDDQKASEARKSIQALIAKDLLREALDQLIALTADHPLQKEILLQSARLESVTQMIEQGIAEFEKTNLLNNQIRKSLLNLVEKLFPHAPTK